MKITEIRIKLMESSEDRLRAFCSITIDGCFVVRDLKIIDGATGPFVAMPSRKLTGHCKRCRHKNHLRANHCNHCGSKLEFDLEGQLDSPQKLYADVAHPINSQCREMIQNAVIREFEDELQRSQQPDYQSRYDEDFDYEDTLVDHLIEPGHSSPSPPKSQGRSRTEPSMESSEARSSSTPANRQQPSAGTESQSEITPSGDHDDDGFGIGVF